MDDRPDAFRLMCRVLSSPYGGDAPPVDAIAALGDEWTAFAATANNHYAGPRVAGILARAGLESLLVDEGREYLELLRAANAERNDEIRHQIESFVPALNAAGVEPLLLKGGAWLYAGDGIYGDERMMLDIDFLVPEGRADAAWDAMTGLGYEAIDSIDQRRFYQMNALGLAGMPATVEIHRNPGPQRTLLTVDEMFERSRAIAAGGGTLRLPAAEHFAVHALFHGQIQDLNFHFARPKMRALLDLRELAAGGAGAVDWAAVAARFAGEGYGAAVPATIALVADWLGWPEPLDGGDWSRYRARCLAHAIEPKGEQTATEKWLVWFANNLWPRRLIYRHRLEGAGTPQRAATIAMGQAAYVLKVPTWPVRRLYRYFRDAEKRG